MSHHHFNHRDRGFGMDYYDGYDDYYYGDDYYAYNNPMKRCGWDAGYEEDGYAHRQPFEPPRVEAPYPGQSSYNVANCQPNCAYSSAPMLAPSLTPFYVQPMNPVPYYNPVDVGQLAPVQPLQPEQMISQDLVNPNGYYGYHQPPAYVNQPQPMMMTSFVSSYDTHEDNPFYPGDYFDEYEEGMEDYYEEQLFKAQRFAAMETFEERREAMFHQANFTKERGVDRHQRCHSRHNDFKEKRRAHEEYRLRELHRRHKITMPKDREKPNKARPSRGRSESADLDADKPTSSKNAKPVKNKKNKNNSEKKVKDQGVDAGSHQHYDDRSLYFTVPNVNIPDHVLQRLFGQFGGLQSIYRQPKRTYGFATYTQPHYALYMAQLLNNTPLLDGRLVVRPRPNTENERVFNSLNATGQEMPGKVTFSELEPVDFANFELPPVSRGSSFCEETPKDLDQTFLLVDEVVNSSEVSGPETSVVHTSNNRNSAGSLEEGQLLDETRLNPTG